MDCERRFYDTTYGKAFHVRPGNNFANRAPPIPEVDPNLIPGHFANNIEINSTPIESKTWQRPSHPEKYGEFLERLKITNKHVFKKFYSNPDVDFKRVEHLAKNSKLTTYQSNYSPEEYESKKESLKWPRSLLDTSRYRYHETTYRTYYNRIEEITEMRSLSKPFTWQHDVEKLKNELRKINKTTQSTYYAIHCAPREAEMKDLVMAGKVWQPPLDRYSLSRVSDPTCSKLESLVKSNIKF